jgi:hypothetical protein
MTKERRKFTMGPMCYCAKHIPGCVPELEKMLEAVYKQCRGVL